jgi:MFS superfamily sulfate permease-like transporter
MNFNAWFQTRSDLRGYMKDLLARRRLSRNGTIKIFSYIRGDLSGAIAAAIVTLLMSIGYGLIAFAPLGADYASHAVLTGVYAAVFCGFFAALFGGTPIQITAPKAPLALALASVLSGIYFHSTNYYCEFGFFLCVHRGVIPTFTRITASWQSYQVRTLPGCRWILEWYSHPSHFKTNQPLSWNS